MELRSIAIGLLTTGTIIGVASNQFASADISSGDRPVLVPIETCRIADTRPAPNNVGPRSTAVGPAETITVNAQQPGTDCTGQIPTDATALSLNVTALNATSNSFITIWPDGDRPIASALNPAPGVRVFNAVTTELATDQTFRVYNNRGNVDVFIDVNGYYENHNHDDRYPTKEQLDARVPPTEIISFMAEGLNYRNLGAVTQDTNGQGLRWQNSGVGGATIELPRPNTWDGVSDVLLRISYHRTTNAAGIVSFFARPDSQRIGDDISTGVGVDGTRDGNSGQNLRRVTEIPCLLIG